MYCNPCSNFCAVGPSSMHRKLSDVNPENLPKRRSIETGAKYCPALQRAIDIRLASLQCFTAEASIVDFGLVS